MGGNAFPDLYIPRLSHEQYTELRDKYIAALEGKYYAQVISPPEPPSKIDHGDIDLMVADPTHDFDAVELSESLGAIQRTKVGVTTSFAVPLVPEQEDKDGRQICAQVDVHLCPIGYLEWEIFLASYGDLAQILGIFNRPMGLTANNKGLYLRIPEIQPYNRKKSMLFLTKDVNEMLSFLGLDAEKYFRGFNSNEEIFEWCISGRFYLPLKETISYESSNDRQRYRKRPMFTSCVTEYIPSHPEAWLGRRQYTRREVLEEAFSQFSHILPAYSAVMAEHNKRCWEEDIMASITSVIPLKGEGLREAMRGLKRFVTYSDEDKLLLCECSAEEIGDKPKWISRIVTTKQKDELVDWAAKNWLEIRARERARPKGVR